MRKITVTKRLHIEADGIELVEVGGVAKITFDGIGFFEKAGEVYQFTCDNGETDLKMATVINRLLEVM